MNILVLGGTGAMGAPLVEILGKSNKVFVTTRSKRNNTDNVIYIQGNAKEDAFFELLMETHYDSIIDFLVYKTDEFKKRIPVLLNHTKHYFFFSSSRCYAESKEPLKETSNRLIDVCMDEKYMLTDEYGLAKGRQEDLLRNSKKKNWTIIRPYITYNSYRLQLGVYEKENWLYRALLGKTIVFPKDIAEKKTTMTYGLDVASAVVELVGNEKAYGEVFHITTNEFLTWGEILDYYCDLLERKTGKRPKVKLLDDSSGLQKVWTPWQIKYDRLYDRVFDSSKIKSMQGEYKYKPLLDGLEECLTQFLNEPKWLEMNWRFEAWCDRQTGEVTSLREIQGLKKKLIYLKWRFIKK